MLVILKHKRNKYASLKVAQCLITTAILNSIPFQNNYKVTTINRRMDTDFLIFAMLIDSKRV